MSATWPLASLRNVIKLRRERIKVVSGITYKRITVRLGGLGVVLRNEVDGIWIKTGMQFVARKGQFVLSKIDARNGAFGLISDDLDQSVVSGNFLTFDCDSNILLPRFLLLFVNRRGFWAECARISEGTTNRVPIRIERFLQLEIPLPPLSEQFRIVNQIDELTAKIQEAQELRKMALKDGKALWQSLLRQAFKERHYTSICLEDACSSIIDNLHSNPHYADSGVPCVRSPDVGLGTISLETALRTDETEYKRRTIRSEPRTDDIVFVREGGGTGKAGIVLPGHRFSLGQRVMMFRPNIEKVLPKYFLYQLLSPMIQEDQIGRLSKGSASPHLNIGAIRKFPFLVPPLQEQQRIVNRLDAVRTNMDTLEKLQNETNRELNDLLPPILDRALKGGL